MFAGLLLPALLVLPQALAQATTKSFVTCVTKQGAASTSPVRTTSKVLTIPLYGFKVRTVTPKTTVTPAAVTTTASTTTTSTVTITNPQSTDTITLQVATTETITSFTSTTETVTAKETLFTTTTSTTTVAASAGFIPVESSIPNSMKKRGAADHLVEARAASNKKQLIIKNGKLTAVPPIYPQAVTCAGLVAVVTTSTITKTAKTTLTVNAPTPVSSTTTTFTTTTTTTVDQPRALVTTTITMTATTTTISTLSTQTTTTETETISVSAPQATFYAACADNNILTRVNGQGVQGVYRTGDVLYSNTANAYDCCTVCITTAGCGGAVFFDGTCAIQPSVNPQCSQNDVAFQIYQLSSSADDGFFTLSNGYCGYTGIAL